MAESLRILDAFAGIGGFSLAAERLVGGFETTQFIELNPFCQSVLSKHWPGVPIHADIRTFKATLNQFDVLTAGFPCQDISKAGKQRGLQGERSGLFYEIMRLVGEIKPKFILLENVAFLYSMHNGEAFQEIVYQITKAGYGMEWACISAKDLGAPHKRERAWIIAYANSLRLEGQVWEKPHCPTWTEETGRRLDPAWRRYLCKPTICRNDDGFSSRVDRYKALGNAIVPLAATPALNRIKQINEENLSHLNKSKLQQQRKEERDARFGFNKVEDAA